MTRRILTILLVALALSCATDDAARSGASTRDEDGRARNRYTPEPGPSPVGVIPSAFLRDAKRDRDVPLTIDYPTAAGPHPLILFSHAHGSNGRGYPGISSHWAGYGYVVIKPTHRDAARQQDLTAADWRNRVADVAFVLDNLDALEEKYPELKGKIDRNRIGVGGHSLGAFTAMLLGGALTSPSTTGGADPRVKAVLAMSPQGPREAWGLTRESWANLKVPTLFMTGTLDQGTDDTETPEWRKQSFELAPAGDKWLIVIHNATHGSFAGRAGITAEEQRRQVTPLDPTPRTPYDPARPYPTSGRTSYVDRDRVVFNAIRTFSLAFWDAYLKNDAPGRRYLESATNRGDLTMERK